MKLDNVHDIQSVYRKVLNSMAEPGKINNLTEESLKVNIDIKCRNSTALIMMMILDREVTFNVVTKKNEEIVGAVSQLTYSKKQEIHEADYIFVLEDCYNDNLSETISKAKIGDLGNPNKSATIIVELDEIDNDENKDLNRISMKGPGIKEVNTVFLSGSTDFIEQREIRNEEYPLGVDLILIDKNHNLICIPRTTRLFKGEV